jgi:MerR family mercuric resistance operon transcriptional regulator
MIHPEVIVMDGLTIGRLAREGLVHVETIRYYERRGLLPRPPRQPSGYRMFPPSAIQVIRFVKTAQSLGFSLKEIKDLLSLRIQPGRSCVEVRSRAERKIVEIDEKLRSLQVIRKALRRLAAACSGRGPIAECPILESFQAGRIR